MVGGPGLSAKWGAPDYFRLFPVSADKGIGILLLKAIGCEQLGCGTDIGSGRDYFHMKHDPSCEIEVYIPLTCKASSGLIWLQHLLTHLLFTQH